MHDDQFYVPKVLQGETIIMASYIINKTPSNAVEGKMLEDVWFGRPADYSLMRTFGCSNIFS